MRLSVTFQADETCRCLTTDGNWGDNLLKASREGHYECVKKLTAQINIRHVTEDIKGIMEDKECINKAILAASREGHCTVLETLISVGGNLNCFDSERKTPIIIAARNGFTNTVKTLINLGADIDFSDCHRRNSMTHAATGRHYGIVAILLAYHPNVDIVALERNTALTLAATKGDTDLVKLFLRQKADINHTAVFGNALSCASRGGHTATVEVLLQEGNCVNSAEHDSVPPRGQTPIMLAADAGHIETMKLLLLWGADIDQEDKESRTSLHHAAQISESFDREVFHGKSDHA